jgi:hypothetical protein
MASRKARMALCALWIVLWMTDLATEENSSRTSLILRPIIPRVRRFSLFPLIQLIRPSFSLVTVPSAKGGTRTEFGDIQLFDLAVLPWPSDETHLKIGLGPMFVFPTATSSSAGQGAWQAGPAMGAVYTGIPWLVMGFLLQNPVSFAYTSPKRPPQNTLEFQPALALHVWKGWYLRSAEATWAFGWRHHSATVLPLSLGVGDVIVRPGLPPLNLYVTGSGRSIENLRQSHRRPVSTSG